EQGESIAGDVPLRRRVRDARRPMAMRGEPEHEGQRWVKQLMRLSAAASESQQSYRPTASVIARREVGLRSYTLGPATTKGLFDRRSGLACTALASSKDTDHTDRSRRAESLRPTSGHGVRRRA